MKDQLIKKYQGYIENLKWHIDTNLTDTVRHEAARNECLGKISVYREFLSDLKLL